MADLVKVKCEAAGQEHLFHFWETLDVDDQQSLLAQLRSIDFDRVNRIYRLAIESEKALQSGSLDQPITPLPEEAFDSIVNATDKERHWRDIGLKAIADGRVGVLLMAGGQGTRLGSTAPKGCYDIGLPSHNSLFQLQAERIAKLQSLAEAEYHKPTGSVIIPWYIMTSGPTRQETELFFTKNNFFALRPANVIFFEQGTLPCLTMDGKIILEGPSKVAVAPDGNGGLYAALRTPLSKANTKHTVLSEMQDRGVAFVHAYGVDNCLVRVADPVFLGCGIAKQADCAVKVVRKHSPSEAVGVVAMRGNKYSVVEYSEISKDQTERRDSQSGELAFRAANIANHFYTTEFLQSVETFEDHLAFHIARKKIPFIDLQSSKIVKPTQPNGMKLELFVFDVFPFAKHFAVMEVDRKDEFSPLKNAPGTGSDDPETSRKDSLAQHARFLALAGVRVSENTVIELSPLVSYAGEGLETFCGKLISRSGYVRSLDELDALQ